MDSDDDCVESNLVLSGNCRNGDNTSSSSSTVIVSSGVVGEPLLLCTQDDEVTGVEVNGEETTVTSLEAVAPVSLEFDDHNGVDVGGSGSDEPVVEPTLMSMIHLARQQSQPTSVINTANILTNASTGNISILSSTPGNNSNTIRTIPAAHFSTLAAAANCSGGLFVLPVVVVGGSLNGAATEFAALAVASPTPGSSTPGSTSSSARSPTLTTIGNVTLASLLSDGGGGTGICVSPHQPNTSSNIIVAGTSLANVNASNTGSVVPGTSIVSVAPSRFTSASTASVVRKTHITNSTGNSVGAIDVIVESTGQSNASSLNDNTEINCYTETITTATTTATASTLSTASTSPPTTVTAIEVAEVVETEDDSCSDSVTGVVVDHCVQDTVTLPSDEIVHEITAAASRSDSPVSLSNSKTLSHHNRTDGCASLSHWKATHGTRHKPQSIINKILIFCFPTIC